MSFLQKYFHHNVYYGNTLFHIGLEGVKIIKIEKNFFLLPTSNKFAILNNSLMELHLISTEKVIKTNWKSENFTVIGLVVF